MTGLTQPCPDCSPRKSAMRSAVRQIEMFMEDGVRERLTVALAVLDIAIEERQ